MVGHLAALRRITAVLPYHTRGRIPRLANAIAALIASSALACPAGAEFTQIWQDSADYVNFGNPVWADMDGDGDLDLVIINHYMPAQLWRNDGGGHFTEVTPPEWQTIEDRHGVAIADYDKDGAPDVYIAFGADYGRTLGKKSDQLWHNDGNFHFTNVTKKAGVTNARGRSRAPRWIDYDRDGDMDLLVLNLNSPHVLYENLGNGRFKDVSVQSGIAALAQHCWTGAVGDFDGDGWPDLYAVGGRRDVLLRNDQHGHFIDATQASGLPIGWGGTGVSAFDADNDGDLDLFVARGIFDAADDLVWTADRIAFADQLGSGEHGIDFRSDGTAVTFALYMRTDVFLETTGFRRIRIGSKAKHPAAMPFTLTRADSSVVAMPPRTTAAGAFDIWRDEDSDQWHLRWRGEHVGGLLYHFGVLTTDGHFTEARAVNFSPRAAPFHTDSFFRNNGNGTFSNATRTAGVAGPGAWSSAGVAAGDFDNDGYLDLYLVNTGVRTIGNLPNTLWMNARDGTFEDRAAPAGVLGQVAGFGEGVAVADIDGDGFLDIFATRGHLNPAPGKGPHLLFKNSGGAGNWVEIKLVGKRSNTDGYDAWVKATAGGLQLTRYTGGSGAGGGDLFSQGHPGLVHFGIGAATQIDRLTVRWAGAPAETFGALAANHLYTIIEGSGTSASATVPPQSTAGPVDTTPAPSALERPAAEGASCAPR